MRVESGAQDITVNETLHTERKELVASQSPPVESPSEPKFLKFKSGLAKPQMLALLLTS